MSEYDAASTADEERSVASAGSDEPTGPLPVLAVVGRPNVGKSTLVNRIIGRREAVVEDRPTTARTGSGPVGSSDPVDADSTLRSSSAVLAASYSDMGAHSFWVGGTSPVSGSSSDCPAGSGPGKDRRVCARAPSSSDSMCNRNNTDDSRTCSRVRGHGCCVIRHGAPKTTSMLPPRSGRALLEPPAGRVPIIVAGTTGAPVTRAR